MSGNDIEQEGTPVKLYENNKVRCPLSKRLYQLYKHPDLEIIKTTTPTTTTTTTTATTTTRKNKKKNNMMKKRKHNNDNRMMIIQ